MSGKMTEIAKMNLSGTNDGKIMITTIEEPYGIGSENIASIGIFLQENAQEPDWKVHIPKENIDAVISALQKAKEVL
ncbi:MAG: hypothetical protein LGB07_01885 [Sulfurovum sp.]|nr:hypothetical protein [Sulfurovum sp.]MCB4744389.1 hypothetical protein [Sulfurovum sp.]MCB4746501.1 hypothetical protein [Sulfurovum sp.]MCB4748301.1 hypothetical protein [Sulfurovum sp.]MCB4749408.1 hypothetical protein [Sulfurovum sp.]